MECAHDTRGNMETYGIAIVIVVLVWCLPLEADIVRWLWTGRWR